MPAKAPQKERKQVSSGERFSRRLASIAGRAGVPHAREKVVGMRPGESKRHRIDLLLYPEGPRQVLVSAKYQGSKGTAEEKLCYEALSLMKLLYEYPERFPLALLVLGGKKAWTLRDYYLSEEFRCDMGLPENLLIVSEEEYREGLKSGRFTLDD